VFVRVQLRPSTTWPYMPTAPSRVLVLAGNSLLCAVLSGLAALFTHLRTLPPSNLAYGKSVGDLLADPFVIAVWMRLVLLGAVLGLVFSLTILWRVKLLKALLVIDAVTVVSAAVSGAFSLVLSPLLALAGGIVAMICCRRQAGWSLDLKQARGST
jgi:hypothetical protein